MNEPTCLHCGSNIERIDVFDSYENVSNVEYLCIGKCPTCDKEYQWCEVYELSHIKDLEEVDE